ncbi:MAG: hypothetical protein AAFZ07_19605 [Actinomycetota bacterium]
MAVQPHAPFAPVTIPTPMPTQHGLFEAAQTITEVNDRWEAGISFQPLRPQPATWDPRCESDPFLTRAGALNVTYVRGAADATGDTEFRAWLDTLFTNITWDVRADTDPEPGAAPDLVIISQAAAVANLGVKYRDLAVPVLNQQPAVADDWGLTTADALSDVSTATQTVHPTRPAWVGFPIGAGVDVYSGGAGGIQGQTLATTDPSVQIALAATADPIVNWVAVAVDAGVELGDPVSVTTAGRRVFTGFDVEVGEDANRTAAAERFWAEAVDWLVGIFGQSRTVGQRPQGDAVTADEWTAIPFPVSVPVTRKRNVTQRELEQLALRALAIEYGPLGEAEFWTGAQIPENYHLTEAAAIAPVPTDPAPNGVVTSGVATPEQAIAELDGAIATYVRSRGIVHIPAFASAVFHDVLVFQGGRWVTPGGNIVAIGAGYPGTGPAGAARAEGTVWVYATPLLGVRISEPMIVPDNVRQAWREGDGTVRNWMRATAERFCVFAPAISAGPFAALSRLEAEPDSGSSGDPSPITPSDTDLLPRVTRGIYVGGVGDVTVLTEAGDTVAFTSVPSGAILPVRAQRVDSTGTTATGLVAL